MNYDELSKKWAELENEFKKIENINSIIDTELKRFNSTSVQFQKALNAINDSTKPFKNASKPLEEFQQRINTQFEPLSRLQKEIFPKINLFNNSDSQINIEKSIDNILKEIDIKSSIDSIINNNENYCNDELLTEQQNNEVYQFIDNINIFFNSETDDSKIMVKKRLTITQCKEIIDVILSVLTIIESLFFYDSSIHIENNINIQNNFYITEESNINNSLDNKDSITEPNEQEDESQNKLPKENNSSLKTPEYV